MWMWIAVGLLTAAAALTGLTSSGSTITKTAHGYSNGDLVALSALTGGAGFVTAYPYFVVGVTANTFGLAGVPGGTAITPTTNLTAGTSIKYTEVTGGSPAYARKAIVFAAAVGGLKDDTTNGATPDVPAGTVDAIGEWSALTAGNLLTFQIVTSETYAAQGTYTITDSKNSITG